MTVVYILTRGGPVDSTQVLASWAYFRGIEGGALGQGAAIALFLFPVLVGVAALMLRLARRRGGDGDERSETARLRPDLFTRLSVRPAGWL